MKAGQAVIGLVAGAIFAASAVMGALGQPPQRHHTDYSARAAFPKTTGKPAGDAFLIDLAKGFDGRTQYLSNHDIEGGWNEMIYRSDNVRFDADGMTLNAHRNSGRAMPYTMSEFQRAGDYGYGRYEVIMRAAAGDGVVSSFFTYTGPYAGDPHTEIDFEFLGRTPTQLHLNYYSEGGVNNPLVVDLWFDTTAAEHLYAFEWLPNSISWFVDGVLVRRVTAETSSVPLPSFSSRVLASVWVGNGATTQWVGHPTFISTQARYKCISHVPLGESRRQCSDAFGYPAAPPDSTSTAS